MTKITKEQYELALDRIEELLPLVGDDTHANDRNAVELSLMSDIVIEYEKVHFPIEKPTIAELIALALDSRGGRERQPTAVTSTLSANRGEKISDTLGKQ